MNILLDIGHPAHVHLFRPLAQAWEQNGHTVLVAARDKDITVDLLNRYGFQYTIVSRMRQGYLGLLLELVEHTYGVYRLARRYNCTMLLGTSVSIGAASKILRAHSIFFGEDDSETVKLQSMISYPLVDTIVTPASLPEDLGGKHVIYDSYQELAYLHPNRYTPDATTIAELGLTPDDTFYVLRLVALRALHDSGHTGIGHDLCREIIARLEPTGQVFITAEGDLADEFKPYQLSISPTKIHDLLAFATLLVCDSQTMTAEAAVLGTPALRYNSFVGRISYLEELEHQYGLTYGFKPGQERELLAKIDELLSCPDLDEQWRMLRNRMLAEKIDPAPWMADLVEKYANEVAQRQAREKTRWTWVMN